MCGVADLKVAGDVTLSSLLRGHVTHLGELHRGDDRSCVSISLPSLGYHTTALNSSSDLFRVGPLVLPISAQTYGLP
jgi:hypothetical protein